MSDLSKLNLTAPGGAHAEIYLHGAHLTSWTPTGGNEVLYLSPKAEFSAGTAIRGGVPIIFPQFADLGPLPKHGFARTRTWELVENGPDWASLRLCEDENSLAIWPHRFELEYSIRIGGKRLELMLKINNTDAQPFEFAAALHTYLRVGNLDMVSIHGLKELYFADNTNKRRESRQEDMLLSFDGEIDRSYYQAVAPVEMIETGKSIRVEQSGFRDVVVWNPGAEKCAALKDMPSDGYLAFVCIEAAVVGKPIVVGPGESWVGKQFLIV